MARSKRAGVPVAAEEYVPEVREPGGYRRSDAAIAEQIGRLLAAEEGLDGSAIVIEVKGGEVTLSGSVRQSADIQRVERCACLAEGVTLVRNGLAPDEPPAEGATPSRAVGSAPKMGKPGYER